MHGSASVALAIVLSSTLSTAERRVMKDSLGTEGILSGLNFRTPDPDERPNTTNPKPRTSFVADPEEGQELFDVGAWKEGFKSTTFEQLVDHTNAYHQQAKFLNLSSAKFHQRVWINDEAWHAAGGVAAQSPFFVILESSGRFTPEWFGLVGEMSKKMGAFVIWVELRLAPESMPFDVSSFEEDHYIGLNAPRNIAANRFGLISVENIMRDVVMLISAYKKDYDRDGVCPVGTFGYATGGRFAAYLRYKFPDVVDFAVASGAPMVVYPGFYDPYAYFTRITETWRSVSGDEGCIELVKNSFKALEKHACWGALAQAVNWEATFYSYPPNKRISAACIAGMAARDAGGSPVEVALALCGDYCSGGSCPAREEGQRTGDMWSWIRCTQVHYDLSFGGDKDFIRPSWSYERSSWEESCVETWGVEPPREGNYHADIFGWHRPRKLADSTSRILFAYGTHSPWAAFAVSMEDISEDLPVVMAKGGTQGAELEARHEEDTEDMLAAKEQIVTRVGGWVMDVRGFLQDE